MYFDAMCAPGYEQDVSRHKAYRSNARKQIVLGTSLLKVGIV